MFSKYTWSVILLSQVVVYGFPTNTINENNEIYNKNYASIVSELMKLNLIPPKPTPENVSPTIKCGVRNENLSIQPRILNGEDSGNNEFPWQIAVLAKNHGKYFYIGGGSIIHPSIVITVAHRVHNETVDRLRIRAGQWNILDNDEYNERQDRNIKKIIIHPNFMLRSLINDISLLILEIPLTFTSFVSPICLPPAYMNFDNTLCTASGWGKDEYGPNGKYQMILKKTDLAIVPHNQCQRVYKSLLKYFKFTLNPTFVCAGGETGQDTCTGDGGSPLICRISNDSKQYYQVGMVAGGIGCGRSGIPGLYTNIPQVRYWIDEQVNKQGFDTTSYSLSDDNRIDIRN